VPLPTVTTPQNEWGISEAIGEFATPYNAGDAPRTQNLTRGAELVNGTVVKPGEVFSLEKTLGEVDYEHGFADAGVISNGQHVDSLGGGLSQVATTVFNAGFEAGMDDTEHHAHQYYFDRYPAGREATLWTGKLDVKFTNSTSHAVLVQAWLDGEQIHVRMWSTKYYDVSITSSDRFNFRPVSTERKSGPGCEPYSGGNPGFDITVASEVMAVFCLAKDISDLKERLGNILVAYAKDGSPVYAKDLKANGAMAALLKDAIKPNLVQTIEGTPAFVHGGPFANIAHGCNSVTATRLAKHLADYAVTEAGFGADLGAEKFCDIKCRLAGLKPDAAVVVATVRALKYNGGVERANLGEENLEALAKGLPNLLKHISNLKNVFGLPVVVAINRFVSDSDAELAMIEKACAEHGVEVSLTEVWGKGGAGGADLARKVVNAIDNQPNEFRFAYDVELSIKDKIRAIAQKVYGAEDVDFSAEAAAEIASLEKLDLDKMPVCMAKTQYSLSDNAKLLGCPEGFRITVRGITVPAGAGFIVALCGNMMKMPGLPKVPAAEKIDVDADGVIHGLF